MTKRIIRILIIAHIAMSAIFVVCGEPDTANFPNEEVNYAEKVWEEFGYSSHNGFQPAYLSTYPRLTFEETPEIDWYFPYFIDFCKQEDLLSYQEKAKGNFSAYDLIFTDFENFYLENSGYDKITYVTGQFIFKKKDENLEIQKIDDVWTIIKNNDYYKSEKPETIELVQTIPAILENPFDVYKTTPETTATTITTAPIITSNAPANANQTAVTKVPVITTAPVTDSKSNPLNVVIIAVFSMLGGGLVVFGIINLVKGGKK
jgi:hypothetical protein